MTARIYGGNGRIRQAARPVSGPRAAWWFEGMDAVRLSLAMIAAVYLSMALELQRPDWAGWTVLSVSLATRASSLQKSLWRAAGSVSGGVVAVGLVAVFAQSTLAFDVALAAWLGLTGFATSVERGQRSYGFALMGYTVPIVTLGDVDHPSSVFLLAVDRCSTLVLGIACAHAASVLVAPDARAVARSLADRLGDASRACSAWLREGGEADPPVAAVLALDSAIVDAFTEQPSLRTGGGAFADAPLRLLEVLSVGLMRAAAVRAGLAALDAAAADALLGGPPEGRSDRLGRVGAVARLLRADRRADLRYASADPLSRDWDGRQAVRNGFRAAVAVSLVNAFWYVSDWPAGSSAVTWTALVSLLLASRPDPAAATRSFLYGAVLAAVIGLALHYTVLTTSGHFVELGAVLLPVGMLCAIGRADRRATLSGGFGLTVLDFVDPTNVMSYRLDASLNAVMADLLGMAVAVVAFSALPPPASAETRRHRAMLRMAEGFRAAALRPRPLRPVSGRWLGRMFGRLALLDGSDDAVRRGGITLLLAGRILLAIRDRDDRLGREVGGASLAGRSTLVALADRDGLPPIHRGQILALAGLLGAADLAGWPGLPGWPYERRA